MKYTIELNDGVFIGTTFGDADVENVYKFIDGFISHKDWKPGSSFLINHLSLNASPLNNEHINQIANLFKKRHREIGAGRCAVVVADHLQYGLSRMIISLTGDKWEGEVDIFTKSIEDALSWIKSGNH